MSDTLSQAQEKELDTKLGKIKVKVPTLPKRLDIERRRTHYSGGFTWLSGLGVSLADMFATLDVLMIECEGLKRRENDVASWDYDTLSEFDLEKLEDAFKKAVEWLNSFRKDVPKK